jgi:hypothetical protein
VEERREAILPHAKSCRADEAPPLPRRAAAAQPPDPFPSSVGRDRIADEGVVPDHVEAVPLFVLEIGQRQHRVIERWRLPAVSASSTGLMPQISSMVRPAPGD